MLKLANFLGGGVIFTPIPLESISWDEVAKNQGESEPKFWGGWGGGTLPLVECSNTLKVCFAL